MLKKLLILLCFFAITGLNTPAAQAFIWNKPTTDNKTPKTQTYTKSPKTRSQSQTTTGIFKNSASLNQLEDVVLRDRQLNLRNAYSYAQKTQQQIVADERAREKATIAKLRAERLNKSQNETAKTEQKKHYTYNPRSTNRKQKSNIPPRVFNVIE